MTNTRLTNIASRQQKSFARDVVFASLIAFAALVGIASVSTAVAASSPAQIASR
ncbi:MAG TPA: hypothetical protein VGM90_26255 [Kofleriaceae bacterium]|jgi:hypothetical protein